jgi:hypothetical protein
VPDGGVPDGSAFTQSVSRFDSKGARYAHSLLLFLIQTYTDADSIERGWSALTTAKAAANSSSVLR